MVVLFTLLVVLVVEGVFARGALNIIEKEEDVDVVVVGEEEDIPLLLSLFSSRSEERVRACSSEDIFVILSLSLSLSLCDVCVLWRFAFSQEGRRFRERFVWNSSGRVYDFFGFCLYISN